MFSKESACVFRKSGRHCLPVNDGWFGRRGETFAILPVYLHLTHQRNFHVRVKKVVSGADSHQTSFQWYKLFQRLIAHRRLQCEQITVAIVLKTVQYSESMRRAELRAKVDTTFRLTVFGGESHVCGANVNEKTF